jgi:hypothetical protein
VLRVHDKTAACTCALFILGAWESRRAPQADVVDWGGAAGAAGGRGADKHRYSPTIANNSRQPPLLGSQVPGSPGGHRKQMSSTGGARLGQLADVGPTRVKRASVFDMFVRWERGRG